MGEREKVVRITVRSLVEQIYRSGSLGADFSRIGIGSCTQSRTVNRLSG